METVVRIDHGQSQASTMSYPQRQPANHRQNHAQQELYKPARSPLPPSQSRYPFPGSPQLQPQVNQLSSQRYNLSAAAQQTGYRDYRQHRISLLHPEYGSRPREVLQGGASIHHLEPIPGLGQQPFKKIRLQDHKEVQPLRIDTREQPGAYNPQVEAISPTLPDHIQQEDQAFRTTKDELLQQIGKVDREIAKTESQISILRKKQQELEESALKPNQKSEVEEDNQPKHQSLAQKIYAENRKKAQSSHAKLDNLGPKVDWPIYNQPLDTPVYHENKRKHVAFKRRLLDYFKKRQSDKETRNSYLTETYSKMMQEWLRKVDKIESSTKRKAKEAKNREFFEKVFPEIRKQREDKESGPRVVKRLVPDLVKQQRFIRVGARIKSEADMDDFIDNLQEQEVEDKKMRSYAVIPPLMLDGKERKLVYQNNNGHIADMGAVHKSRQFLNIWTRTEKEVFKEKYLQHPKNFHVISSYLEKKSVADCVEYYYLSKKTESYKQLLRKSKMRPRTRNNPQKANAPAVDILTPGVTTRLQREQQQKTGVQPTRDNNTSDISTSVANTSTTPPNSSTPTLTTSTSSTVTTSVTSSAVSVTSCDATPTPTSTPCSVISSTSVASTITSVMATSVTTPSVIKNEPTTDGNVTGTGEDSKNSSDLNTADGKKFLNDVVVKVENNSSSNDGCNNETTTPLTPMLTTTVKKEEGSTENSGSDQNLSSNAVVENKKKKERRKDKENSQLETSEDESPDLHDKSVQGQCIVCGSQLGPQLQSRPLAPNQASLYGLREEQIPPNGRVCNTCRCKCVRSRYTHCPLPSCPNARGRVKRLRSFPQRFQELPPDIRDPLLAEFHIPSGVTKCCSACFNRIQRRLGPVEEWPEEEIAQLRTALTEIGPNWSLVGMRLNKPAVLVRSFYATNRKALSLESCLGDRKPTLTDEEESGSSTSSCEEPLRERHSSDTVSAESPPVNHEQPTNPVRKEDYDSSATETADESQTPDHYQGSATITPVNNDGQPRQNTSPLTVKDLMLNVIEISLMKTSGAQQTPHLTAGGITPTISSILNNDSNEVTIVSEYNLNNQPRPQRNELSIAKLVTPLIGATITPVPAPVATQEAPSRDDLVVLQVQDGRDNENLTLDLSIKKNRELPPPAHVKHAQQIRTEAYLYHTQERKSPAVYVSARVQPKLPSPKPANPKAGSITLGTPIISQQQRYDGLLRHVAPEPKMGSITQGTPIHVSHVQDKRIYESFYNKRAAVPQNVGQNPNFPAQYRQPAYSIDQQLSNRQIIMNDYITSQQMLGRRNDKPTYYATSSPHRTPPPQQSQQRQGVIQRHTRPHYPPPGHEALTSLVDVAVQQPSLPVPSAPHEGLGKTIADNILEQPHRFQNMMHQQQMRQQQQRMEAERRAYHQQQQQQAARQQQQQQQQQQQVARSDSSTLTAASLIDAIITHQINQTEPGREVVTNNREPPRPGDRLFQGFHREAPSAQQDNNGDRPPSVISVDLDSDTVNKNLTVKELTDSVISHDFNARGSNYFHHQENMSEQWKRRLQQQQQQAAQQQQKEEKRSGTPQQDERQIIRIAQPQKYHVEPVSPPESNHWSEQNYRRYQQPQSHLSAFDYVKNRIVEVMRTEDDKKESQEGGAHAQDKDRSDSPGDMVIDEEKHENEFANQQPQSAAGFSYPYVAQKDNNTANDSSRNTEPKPLLSAQYEPLSDED